MSLSGYGNFDDKKLAKYGEAWKSKLYGCINDYDDKLREYKKEELYDELFFNYDDIIIINISIYKHSLSKLQYTNYFLHHDFVVFETFGYYWSIEKNGEGICLQRSRSRHDVTDSLGPHSRDKEATEYYKWKPTHYSLRKLLDSVYDDEIDKEYHIAYSNCQKFAYGIYMKM